MKIIILGLHKADVLLALYNHAKFAGNDFEAQPLLKVIYENNPCGCIKSAHELIDNALKRNEFYFDFIDLGAGLRPLKVDLSGFYFESSSYDNFHGFDGYAGKVIDQLRAAIVAKLKEPPKDSPAGIISQIGLVFKSNTNSDNDLAAAASKSLKF